MKTLFKNPTKSGLDLLSLTSIEPRMHNLSGFTVKFLGDLEPFVEQLDLTAEPEVIRYVDDSEVSVVHGGFMELVSNAYDQIPGDKYSQEELEVILRDILFFSPNRSSNGDVKKEITHQALMIVVLKRYMKSDISPQGLSRLVSLLSFCNQIDYETRIRVGKPIKLDRTRNAYSRVHIYYNLRSLIDACFPDLDFADDLTVKAAELEEMLESDPYCLFLLPQALLDSADHRMFEAFETMITDSGVYFGHIWLKWLGEEKFRPFWTKLLQSQKNQALAGKMIDYPRCPERRNLEGMIGADTIREILESVPQVHHTVGEFQEMVNGTLFSEKKRNHRKGNPELIKANIEARRFRRQAARKGTNGSSVLPGVDEIPVSPVIQKDVSHSIPEDSRGNMTVILGSATPKKLDIVGDVQGDVAKILAPQQPREKPMKTLVDTMNIWGEALDDKRFTSEIKGDVVILILQRSYWHRIHDKSFNTLKIDASGITTPDIGVGDLSSKIQNIVHHLREKKQKEEIENELKEAEKALEGTQTLWGLAIADGDHSYEIGKDGTVLFKLSPHLLDLVHDGTFGTIFVAQDGSMSHGLTPELEGQLQILAEEMRVQAKDDAERKAINDELRPIYDILEGDLKITEDTVQPTALNDVLKAHGALIILDGDRSVMWLHLANGMKIKYFSGGIFHIHTYGQSLSPIRKELYNELGEVLDRIGCILCEKNKEKRKTRITAVQNRRDDVESLFTRIKEGRAYTLLTNDSSYLNGGEFPRSHISGMVQKFHSHKPQTKEEQSTHIILCADSLHFTENLAGNGLNGLELSPWGRQILWERICRTKKDIPLGDALIYTQKKLRGKITRKPKELLDKVVWEGDREVFLDEYIGLLETNEINVHYGPFVTMKWSEYLREVERRQPKQLEEQPTTPTADGGHQTTA